MNHPFSQLSWDKAPTEAVDRTTAAATPGERVSAALANSPLFTSPAPVWVPDTTPEQTPDQTSSTEIDWQVVRELQTEAAEKVRQASAQYEAKHGREPHRVNELPALALPVIHEVVQRWVTTADIGGVALGDLGELEQRYTKAVHDSLYGLGRLQPLLEIPDAENVIISGAQPVIVEHNDGRRSVLPPVADSSQDLTEQLQRMAENSVPRRAFDASHLDMTLMLHDKFRIHAVSDEISHEPSVVIRQHLMTKVSLGDLADGGLMPTEVAEFLDQAVQAGLTIVVAGEQGVGKTTFLRALIHAIPTHERFATLETDLELFAHKLPGREHTLVMFARDGMGERDEYGHRDGEVTVADMVRPALRQGLGRIIVGEVRGVEASAMFQAMQSGTGTMSSIHSPHPHEVPIRLADVIAQGRIYSIEEALRQVALSVDLIVYIRRRDSAGVRKRFIEAIHTVELGDSANTSTAPSLGELHLADPWTGEQIQWTPGELGKELAARFRRPLERIKDRADRDAQLGQG